MYTAGLDETNGEEFDIVGCEYDLLPSLWISSRCETRTFTPHGREQYANFRASRELVRQVRLERRNRKMRYLKGEAGEGSSEKAAAEVVEFRDAVDLLRRGHNMETS